MQKIFSLIIVIVGFLLTAYMISVEDEPGALPLLLIVAGAGWYLFTRKKLTS
ncbi:PEP-CTERM sorting domain-containing protein [Rhodohalobacter halophilus]|uniref:PEP-CTERM sorting domain-containing protein n=1 Tax=Rhodohalobacter halophilus TaxID=1812810 RepID=UPI00114D1A24|nr:PEP-CTERM sorting domain-containing protein [Rhodohalobacter halophilus]